MSVATILMVCVLGPVVRFSMMFMAYMVIAKKRELKAHDIFDVFIAELVISFILVISPLFILNIALSLVIALIGYYFCKNLTKREGA